MVDHLCITHAEIYRKKLFPETSWNNKLIEISLCFAGMTSGWVPFNKKKKETKKKEKKKIANPYFCHRSNVTIAGRCSLHGLSRPFLHIPFLFSLIRYVYKLPWTIKTVYILTLYFVIYFLFSLLLDADCWPRHKTAWSCVFGWPVNNWSSRRGSSHGGNNGSTIQSGIERRQSTSRP